MAAQFIDTTGALSPVEVADSIKYSSSYATAANPISATYYEQIFFGTDWVKTIYVFPTPATITTQKLRLIYRSEVKIPQLDTDVVIIPAYLNRYVNFRLAADLAHEYGISVNEINVLEVKAEKSLSFILDDNETTSFKSRDHRFNSLYKQGVVNINEEI